MSNEQISDLRVTLARLEERQIQLFSMVETSLANYADVANRLGALEHLRTKVLAVAGLNWAGLLNGLGCPQKPLF
jgi:hypothetical protein